MLPLSVPACLQPRRQLQFPEAQLRVEQRPVRVDIEIAYPGERTRFLPAEELAACRDDG